jgi:hypothetical protein
MSAYKPKIELRQRFAHQDGREVWVYRDHARECFIVEVRAPRVRLLPETEVDLDAVLRDLMADDEGWREHGRRAPIPPWTRSRRSAGSP